MRLREAKKLHAGDEVTLRKEGGAVGKVIQTSLSKDGKVLLVEVVVDGTIHQAYHQDLG